MSRIIQTLALFLSFTMFSVSVVQAHSGSTDFGSIETIQSGHYHFHLPMEMDLQGNLHVHSWLGESHGESAGDQSPGGHHEEPANLFTLALSGDLDRIRRTVIRSKLELTAESWRIPLATRDAPRFRLVSRRGSWGVGPDMHAGSLAIGLLPGKETVFFHQLSCATSHCENSFFRRFPTDISDWRGRLPGERAVYSKGTALHVHLSAGQHVAASAGPLGVIEGAWTTAMELLPTGELSISVSRDRMRSIGIEAEAILVSGAAAKQWNRSYSYDFLVHPETSEGREAYRALLAGRIDAVQRMALPGSGVQLTEKSRGRSRARSLVFQGGVPVLSGIGLEKTTSTISTRTNGETSHVTIQQELIRGRGILSRHLLKGRFVVASAHQVEHEDHEDQVEDHRGHDHDLDALDYGVTTLWIFERDRMRDERLERWLRRKGRKFGIPELARLEIDTRAKGYLRGELKVIFPMSALEAWLKLEGHGQESVPPLPAKLRNSDRWQRLQMLAREAQKKKDARRLSQILAKAGTVLTRNLKEIRLHAAGLNQALPLIYEVKISGDSIPEVTKAWRMKATR